MLEIRNGLLKHFITCYISDTRSAALGMVGAQIRLRNLLGSG